MKAQDKIYVAPHQIFDYDLDVQEVGHNGAEEYIRKKAILKFIYDMIDQLNDRHNLDFDCGYNPQMITNGTRN